MKIKFIGVSDFNSKGYRFAPGKEYEVEDEFGSYLLKTFVSMFEAIKVEPEVIVDEEESPKRKTRTKKAVPTEE